MNNYLISTTCKCGKTLNSFFNYIEQMRNMKVDNYVLYIDKIFWHKYKNELKDYLLDIEIIITENLPETVNAIFCEKKRIKG